MCLGSHRPSWQQPSPGCSVSGDAQRKQLVQPWLILLQERRIRERVEGLERDTGVKLRVLAQNYPQVGWPARAPGASSKGVCTCS